MISLDEIMEICKGCAEYRDIGGVRYCGINYPEHGGMCHKHLAAQEARTRREVLEWVQKSLKDYGAVVARAMIDTALREARKEG